VARGSLVQIAGLRYGAGALKFDARLVRIEAEALEELVNEAFETCGRENHCDHGVDGVGDSPVARGTGDIEERSAIEGVSCHWYERAAA
jgi:hypothetical protein